MNRFGAFLSGLVLGVAAFYGVMHYSVVRAADGFHIIPKVTPKLDNPYADIRTFSPAMWQRRQALAVSIVRANKGYLLSSPSLQGFKLSIQRTVDQLATRL